MSTNCPKCHKTAMTATENGKSVFFCVRCNHSFSDVKIEQVAQETPKPHKSPEIKAQEAETPLSTPRSKYGNEWQEYEGAKFQSSKELKKWKEFQLREMAGEIQNLRRQVRYKLYGKNGTHVTTYIADMVYTEDGKEVVADVKGWQDPKELKTQLYKIKKKLLLDNMGITILEL